MNDLPAYTHLSRFYDSDWGSWCLKYNVLLDEICSFIDIFPIKFIDLGCGTGVLAEELTKKGHIVYGIDLSPNMIHIAQSKKIKGAHFDVSDMSNYTSESKFNGAICTFDAFNYLIGFEKITSFFKCTAEVLLPGAVLLFDFNTDYLFRYYHNGTIHRVFNGIEFDQMRSYNPQTKIARTEFLFPNATREIHIQQAWEIEEVLPVLKKSGFKLLNQFNTFINENKCSEIGRFICIAQK